MHAQQTHLIYEFGDFELDALRRVLVTRADGQPVEITGRVLEALVYLVERPGQLVEKKALIEALWPHVVVEEGSLTQTIHTLRRALGERPGEHRYIATVPGRGYRFVAEVSVRAAQAKSDTAPPPSRWSKANVAGVALSLAVLAFLALLVLRGREQPAAEAPAVVPPSIAVLPFVDMSTAQDQEHFAEGLSEEILNLLAHSDNLRVIARTSSFSFKGQNADVRTIAQRLTVTHVLEGSVRKSGERVRITAQLIDGASGAHVWSETYDRDEQDVFGVQTEIASAVAGSLKVTLRGDRPRRAETNSTQAYEHYLQGRHLFHRRSGPDVVNAKTHFEEAVRIDPGFARAWAALAGVYFVAHFEGPELPDAASKWREAAQRAVTLAPDLAEANMRAAQYYWLAGDQDAANKHVARAAALDPTDPLVMGAAVSDAVYEGRVADAVELQRRTAATDPLSATERGNLGSLLLVTGDLDGARAELERALELSPAAVSTKYDIAYVLLLQGRIDEALKAIQQLPDGHRRDLCLALAYFTRGDVTEGDAMLTRLLAAAATPIVDTDVALSIASVYTIRNDPDQAFKWLGAVRRQLQSQEMQIAGTQLMWSLQTAPFLTQLHADPRWKELLASIDAR